MLIDFFGFEEFAFSSLFLFFKLLPTLKNVHSFENDCCWSLQHFCSILKKVLPLLIPGALVVTGHLSEASISL